ncbi:MAG TPA: type I-E CRISPR-associated protein Cse1/CasA, partial [Burkholderiaceae bacterium]|nr:type I-E CRISPR-associated protein Cse1/CasA [Burkholderiaceae bacterium]
MNLLHDEWLTVRRRDGSIARISPAGISPECNNPAIELIAPRPDFRGAQYQFLIGLLQTACGPDERDEWHDQWDAGPSVMELTASFERYANAFQLNTDGPAFMQDFNLPDGETKPIAALLIDAPGGKTINDNLDHFIKRDTVGAICPVCAATALFTLQINAPSGGVGHRVSLRGGGPLTTLVLPRDEQATLWHKLWLNVLPKSELNVDALAMGNDHDSAILPWLATTRVSDIKGSDTTPGQVHPLQAYWSMPRRIRLDFTNVHAGKCEICGADSDQLISQYRAKNYGINYTGAWLHPLTPYSFYPKNEKPPLSVKGQ